MLRRFISLTILLTVYSTTAFLAQLMRRRRRRVDSNRQNILIIGTFHNPNWVTAHIIPLREAGIGRVIVVADNELLVDDIDVVIPPRWLSRLLSRAGAKFFTALVVAIRTKPGLIVGYHIFPAAISSLLIGSFVGSPTCYQVTSGSLELDGGGWHSENRILAALSSPSRYIQKLAIRVVRQFELTVVRGSGAENFLRENGVDGHIIRITGSTAFPPQIPAFDDRLLDIIFVGRLTEYKRPDRFLATIKKLVQVYPKLNVAMIGDGPDRAELEQMAEEYGISNTISFLGQQSDVTAWLCKAKLFVLTSRWEGVSIALLEAMACGTVPIVSDVGDLKDFVHNEETGFILAEDDIDGFAEKIAYVLDDERVWESISNQCRDLAGKEATLQKIAERWSESMKLITKSADQ